MNKTIVMVIPTGASHWSINAVWRSAAYKYSWLWVLSPEAATELADTTVYKDPGNLWIFWDALTPWVASKPGGAKRLFVYSEAYDKDRSKMLVEHWDFLERVMDVGSRFDGFLAHTPDMVHALRPVFRKQGWVLPAGYHEILAPRVPIAVRDHKILYWGSDVGIRRDLVPELVARNPVVFENASGLFGERLQDRIEQCEYALYIPHSPVASFSTWRIWQVIATGSGFGVYKCPSSDWWPLVASDVVQFRDEDFEPGAQYGWHPLEDRRLLELRKDFHVDRVVESWLLTAYAVVVSG